MEDEDAASVSQDTSCQDSFGDHLASELENESNLDEEDQDHDKNSSQEDENEEEEDEPPTPIFPNLSADPPMRVGTDLGSRPGEGPSGCSQTPTPRESPFLVINDPKRQTLAQN